MVRNGAGRYAVNAEPGTRAVRYRRVTPSTQYGGFSPCEPGGRLAAPDSSPRSRRCRSTTVNGQRITADFTHSTHPGGSVYCISSAARGPPRKATQYPISPAQREHRLSAARSAEAVALMVVKSTLGAPVAGSG